MTLLRFTSLFAFLGVTIPLVFRWLWWSFQYFKITDLDIHIFVQKLMLMLWPSSLMSLPASDGSGFETKLFLMSLVANVFLYGIIGVGIWFGLRRHISFFVPVSLVVITVWWILLSLH